MKKYFSLVFMVMLVSRLLAGTEEYASVMFHHYRNHMAEDTFKRKHIFKGRRFCGILEVGFSEVLPHDSVGNMPAFYLNYMMGGHVTPWYSMGLSLGFTVYGRNDFDLELMGDFRFQFGKRKRLMPYLSSPGGYIAKFHYVTHYDGPFPYRSANEYDGFIINPTVGLRYAVSHGFAVNIGLGYRMIGVFMPDYYDNYHLVFSHGLTLKTGINF